LIYSSVCSVAMVVEGTRKHGGKRVGGKSNPRSHSMSIALVKFSYFISLLLF